MHEILAKSILSPQNGMNLYRGCTHGCIYCDSRSKCYHMDHAFTDVAVKKNAPELLERALKGKRSRCMVGTGAMCDPYLPLEAELCLTRRCGEIVERYGCGLTVITKSDLVLRDLDLFQSIHARSKCVLQMTLTTADGDLCRLIEPNVCPTARRAEVLNRFREEGIPTVVWLSPILPFLNDTVENLDCILRLCFDAGVKGILCFGMGVTMREGNREYFFEQLDKHFPGMKARYIRSFGDNYVCGSPRNDALMARFHAQCEAHGVMHDNEEIFRYLATFEDRHGGEQMSLF